MLFYSDDSFRQMTKLIPMHHVKIIQILYVEDITLDETGILDMGVHFKALVAVSVQEEKEHELSKFGE